jgi:hypothetical protein
MTATAPPPPTPPVFVAPPRPPRRSRAAVWLGTAVVLVGTLLALGGGAVLAVVGTDGELSTGRHELATPTTALVSEPASIDGTDDLGVGRPTVRLSATPDGGKPVFVGVGRAADVERYLEGAATDEITDFDLDPFRTDRDRHAGDAVPAAPGSQDFWVERSGGTGTARIDWELRDGDYRLVVMNADGSAGVATRSAVGVDIPFLPGVAFGALAAGLLLAGGGLAAAGLGARRA